MSPRTWLILFGLIVLSFQGCDSGPTSMDKGSSGSDSSVLATSGDASLARKDSQKGLAGEPIVSVADFTRRRKWVWTCQGESDSGAKKILSLTVDHRLGSEIFFESRRITQTPGEADREESGYFSANIEKILEAYSDPANIPLGQRDVSIYRLDSVTKHWVFDRRSPLALGAFAIQDLFYLRKIYRPEVSPVHLLKDSVEDREWGRLDLVSQSADGQSPLFPIWYIQEHPQLRGVAYRLKDYLETGGECLLTGWSADR